MKKQPSVQIGHHQVVALCSYCHASVAAGALNCARCGRSLSTPVFSRRQDGLASQPCRRRSRRHINWVDWLALLAGLATAFLIYQIVH